MRDSRSALIAVLLVGSVALSAPAEASPPIIDGRLDSAYGPALVTQTIQTQTKNTLGTPGGSNGWELDEGYGFISDGVLYLMLTGNMLLQPRVIEPGTVWSPFDLFIDSGVGGQNQLRSDNDTLRTGNLYWAHLHSMSGLTFDADFVPDYWLGFAGSGGPDDAGPYELLSFFAGLPSSSGASVTYLGSAQVGGPDTLSGGSNPDGLAVALDNSNLTGVSQGCGASSGAGASTGFEFAIPLAAIGNPVGPIKVCAVFIPEYANQVLGPVPPGTCSLGASSSVNFATIPGNQFFVVNPTTAVVSSATPPGLSLAPMGNPSPAMTVMYTLAFAAPAQLEVIDSSGRRVLARSIDGGSTGPRALQLARGRELPPGVYFVHLRQGSNEVTARSVVTQ
jgi:hypothetical protein